MSFDLYTHPEIHADGTVTFRGLDFEGCKVHLHSRNLTHLVLKVTGGSGWAGRGARAYRRTHFIVLRIVSEKPLRTEEVVQFDLRPRD